MALTRGRAAGPGAPVALTVCAIVLAPTLAFRLGVDQGVFAYMGNAVLHGAWPYVHTWESDFPGLMFLQAAEILVLGKSVAAFRLFDLLVQLANAYLIFRIAERLSGRIGAMFAAVLFCLIYQGYGPWNTAQREGFALVFVLAGYWMYFTADRRPAVFTAVAIGLGLGVAVTFKPTILALAAFYAPLLMELRHRRAVRLVATATAVLVAPAAVIVVGYWLAGHLSDLYEACVAYQAIYTARLRGHEPLLVYWWGKLGRLGLNSVVLPVVYVPCLFSPSHRRERLMIWIGYLGSLYSVFVQGTYAGYHYLPGLSLGAVLVGDMVTLASDRLLGTRSMRLAGRQVPATLLAVGMLLSVAGVFYMRRTPLQSLFSLRFLGPPAPGEFRNGTVFDFTESYDTAAYLRERTEPHQPIQVWGYESLVYYLADRRAASRFQMTHPLVMRPPGGGLTPMQQRWRAEFIRDIEHERPAYVAVVTRDNWWWAPEERTSQEMLDDFPEWKAIIERDYVLERTIGRFLVYRRLPAATGRPSA